MVAFTWVRNYFRVNSNQDKTKVHSRQSNSVKLAKAEPSQRLINIINLYDQAKSCEACFIDTPQSERADIFGGQPRWIGKHYFNEKFSQEEYPRVLVLLLRPGQLGGRKKDFDFNKYNTLMGNMKDPNSWNDLMELINADSRHWGKYDAIYEDSMKLKKDFTAFLNIGLCAGLAASDVNPLSVCFEKYTRQMIETFQPNILMLNGKKVQQFYEKYVDGSDYSSSKRLIEKQLISKGIFTGKPFKVKSYAARGVEVELEAIVIDESLSNLYRNEEKSSLSSSQSWKFSELILALDFYDYYRRWGDDLPAKDSKEMQELVSHIRDLNIHSNQNLQPSFRNEDEVYQKLISFLDLDTGGNDGMDKVIIENLERWHLFTYPQVQLRLTANYINRLRDNYVDRYSI